MALYAGKHPLHAMYIQRARLDTGKTREIREKSLLCVKATNAF
jgi:hypothetical protein